MNFADRTQAQAREKAENGARAGFTKEQFDDAVTGTLEELMDNPDLAKGMTGAIVPIIGLAFASKLRARLFEKEDK